MTLIERRPTLHGWSEVHGELPQAIAISAWQRGKVRVISALENAELPDGNGSGTGPQWHISITRNGQRPRPLDLRAAFRAFGFQGAEEDNHHPGNARHFWIPVDPAHRVDCQCKIDESVIVEPDGYTWTNPKDDECRGCEFARMFGKSCPLHDGAAP